MTQNRGPLRAPRLCFCGCKTEIGDSSHFARGHDNIAEAALLAIHFEASTARLLADHGYGPDNSVVDAAVAHPDTDWERCPVCQHPGNPQTMRHHQKMHARSERATKVS